MDPISADASARFFQECLLASVAERVPGLSSRVREAFFNVPRHKFVTQYRTLADDAWHCVNEANLVRHLPALYRDDGLGIFGEDPATGVTISSLHS